MSANTILTSIVTAGSNNHTTSAEEVNALSTDFVTQGVVGAITLNTGSGGTGSFCVNQNTGSDMAIIIKAGQAYISATPSSQGAQVVRARAASDYTAFSISSNASGSTKYDWVYLKVDPTKANNPASDASDVTSIVVSRSSSNTTDNGTPPTYGVLLAVITVTNGASAITNGNITDKRVNASIGAQNGSLIVTQQTTGTDAKVVAAGQDANINLDLTPKGTGTIVTPNNVIQANSLATNAITLGYSQITSNFVTASTTQVQVTGLSVTCTVPSGGRRIKITVYSPFTSNSASGTPVNVYVWQGTVGTGTQLQQSTTSYFNTVTLIHSYVPTAGSYTYNVGMSVNGGTGTLNCGATSPAYILVEAI